MRPINKFDNKNLETKIYEIIMKKINKITNFIYNRKYLKYLRICILHLLLRKILYEKINSLWIDKIFKLQKGLTVYKADYISKQ
jgi:hypothetical protein